MPPPSDTEPLVTAVAEAEPRVPERRYRRSGPMARREALTGLLWVQAWFIGFVVFTLGPIIAALYLGFTDWRGRGAPQWVGLRNFKEIFTDDPLFWQSLKVTLLFAVIYLPLSLIIGFAMAMVMNQRLVGVKVFRTLYFLPSVLSGTAVAILWQFVFNRDFGVLNWFLGLFGLEPVSWLVSPQWVIPALVIMQLWAVGSSIIIYLGGLQGIPTELYEVARIDGAGWWASLRHVTLPMMSPVIFFQLVLGLIATFQIFTQPYVMTQGGPDNASYFYALYIYNTAFVQLRLGYASALSVILFVIVVGITAVIFRTSKAWVYYAGGTDS